MEHHSSESYSFLVRCYYQSLLGNSVFFNTQHKNSVYIVPRIKHLHSQSLIQDNILHLSRDLRERVTLALAGDGMVTQPILGFSLALHSTWTFGTFYHNEDNRRT